MSLSIIKLGANSFGKEFGLLAILWTPSGQGWAQVKLEQKSQLNLQLTRFAVFEISVRNLRTAYVTRIQAIHLRLNL